MKIDLAPKIKGRIEIGDFARWDDRLGFICFYGGQVKIEDYDAINDTFLEEPYIFVDIEDMHVAAAFPDLDSVNTECELIAKQKNLKLMKEW